MTQAARNGEAPKLRVDTVATRDRVRFFSNLVQVYLTEGLGIEPDSTDGVQVRLAVLEVITNVVRHAYAGRTPGPITLEMERDGEALVCAVGDRAERFDPFEGIERGRVEMPSPEQLATGGYGLGIIDRVMDEVDHAWSPEGGNRLTMRVRLWR